MRSLILINYAERSLDAPSQTSPRAPRLLCDFKKKREHCALNALAQCMHGIMKREFLLELGRLLGLTEV